MSALETFKRWLLGEDVLETARSLRANPEAWSDDSKLMGSPYFLTHTSGVSVWVASGAWAVSINGPERFGSRGPLIWGGVGDLSALGLSIRHWVLWVAARSVLSQRQTHPSAAEFLDGAA